MADLSRLSLLRVLHSILCCRILLNIRMAGAPTPYSMFSHAVLPSTSYGTTEDVLDTRFTTMAPPRTIVDSETHDAAWYEAQAAEYDDVPLASLRGSDGKGSSRPSGSDFAGG